MLTSAGVLLKFQHDTLEYLYSWIDIHSVQYNRSTKFIRLETVSSDCIDVALEDTTGAKRGHIISGTAQASKNRSRRLKGQNYTLNMKRQHHQPILIQTHLSTNSGYDLDDLIEDVSGTSNYEDN